MSSLSLNSPLVAIPLFAALTFMIVGSPVVFQFTHSKLRPIINKDLITPSGCPNRTGVIIHALVAGLIMYALLRSYSPESSLY